MIGLSLSSATRLPSQGRISVDFDATLKFNLFVTAGKPMGERRRQSIGMSFWRRVKDSRSMRKLLL
jgi:hypothetical protein